MYEISNWELEIRDGDTLRMTVPYHTADNSEIGMSSHSVRKRRKKFMNQFNLRHTSGHKSQVTGTDFNLRNRYGVTCSGTRSDPGEWLM